MTAGRVTRIGVLALQGDVREHARALTEVGAEPLAVRRPDDLDKIDGLILPGGESTTIGKLLDLFGLLEPLRAAVKNGLPVFGSCAGMILLADEVLDGRPGQATIGGLDIAVRRNAFGRQVESFETDLAWAGLGDVHAVFIRAPWVERTGAGVEELARIPVGPNSDAPAAGKVVAVRHGPLLATSFHPELTGDPRVHGLFVRIVKESSA
jgi:5'-phosphate synthase pdxT subunit